MCLCNLKASILSKLAKGYIYIYIYIYIYTGRLDFCIIGSMVNLHVLYVCSIVISCDLDSIGIYFLS